MSVLRQLATEEMILFKEKINYKLAGSGKKCKPTALDRVPIDATQVASPRISTLMHILTSRK